MISLFIPISCGGGGWGKYGATATTISVLVNLWATTATDKITLQDYKPIVKLMRLTNWLASHHRWHANEARQKLVCDSKYTQPFSLTASDPHRLCRYCCSSTTVRFMSKVLANRHHYPPLVVTTTTAFNRTEFDSRSFCAIQQMIVAFAID